MGTNNITVTYAGNSYYTSVSAKKTFQVSKQNMNITLTKIKSVAYGENITITGKLMDKTGKLLTNTPLKLNINKKTVSVKTNTKGVYKYTYKVTIVGTNNITVTYAGNNNYNKITTKTTVKIIKQTTKITVTATKQVKYGNNVTVTGKLTDKNGKILANSVIKVSINGKSVTTKTNSKGVYKITRTTNKIGANNVVVTYAGNTNFNKISKKVTFNVVKQNVKISATVKQVSGTKKVKITGKLITASNQVIKKSNVILTLNGVKKTVKTNNNGVFTLTTTGKTGTNTLIPSFVANTYYNKYTGSKITFKIV